MNKAVLSVPVDASAFEAFLVKFDAYQKQLDAQPELWKKINEEMSRMGLNGPGNGPGPGSGSDLGKMTEALKDSLGLAAANAVLLAEALGKASREQQHLERHVEKTERSMSKLRRLAHWGGGMAWRGAKHALRAGAMVGGIAGGFGLFEMLHYLPNRVTQLGLQAGGLGVSPGYLQAFNIGMTGMLQNPGQIPTSLWGLQHNIGALAPIAALTGINPMQAANESLPNFSEQMFTRLPDLMAKFPKYLWSQIWSQFGLGATGFSLHDIQREMGMSDAQRKAFFEKQVKRREHELNLQKQTVKNWEVLNRTLKTAEARISTALIDGLSPFTKDLGKASRAISTEFTSGIKWLFNKQHWDELKKGFGDFEAIAKHLAIDMAWFGQKLGWIPDSGAGNSPSGSPNPEHRPYGYGSRKGNLPFGLAPDSQFAKQWIGGNYREAPAGMRLPTGPAIMAGKDIRYLVKLGVPEETAESMVANAIGESSLDPSARNGGSVGLFGWRGSRRTAEWNRFLAAKGYPFQPLSEAGNKLQLQFAVWEMQHGNDAGARRFWKNHGNTIEGLQDKTAAFYNEFERPGPTDKSLPRRELYAHELQEQFPAAAWGAPIVQVLHSIDRSLKQLLSQNQRHHNESTHAGSGAGSSYARSAAALGGHY